MRLLRYSYPASRALSSFGFNRSPFGGLDAEINRLLSSAYTGLGALNSSGSFPVDLYQDEANTFVRAELPGVSRENIDVEVKGDELTITATRKTPASGEQAETSTATSRTVTVPEGTPSDKITAAYENGILTVTLPKPEAAKPRKVNVQIS